MRLLLCLALLFPLSARAELAEQDVAYGPLPEQRLDVCAPVSPRPGAAAVLLIHGGGWRNGDRTKAEHLCPGFTEAGIFAFPIDYRLVKRPQGNAWPAQIEDAQLALRWVRTHAAEWGIDPQHICAEGDSAGAHLAMLLDELPAIVPGDMAGQLSGVATRADCAVAISPPADLVKFAAMHRNGLQGLIEASSPADAERQEIAASPVSQVRAGMGPVLILHGLNDPHVPYAQAQELLAALLAAHVPAWLVTHTGAHVFRDMPVDQKRRFLAVAAQFVQTLKLPVPPGNLQASDLP